MEHAIIKLENKIYSFLVFCITGTASFSLRQPGWLDKVVVYHKNKLFDDFRKLPTVKIKATLEVAPPGYVDSTEWDFPSVIRLLNLIRASETAIPVRRALRRILGGRRRMNFQESVKAFPSLSKDLKTYIYYDWDSGEYYGDVVTEETFPDDEAIIVVSNPVEARLPSAKISISLLRDILESRAKAARYMPTTQKTFPWSSMTKATTTAAPADATKNEDSEDNKDSTGGTDATGGGDAPATDAPE
ncbi:uncharacterized protein [Epargyreus clarus]|uniref:uncharacterized protein n=1 Tax=Epargyreus clarus TaxID=520877 RepID=UPI003C30949C